jgi:predicted regulator of Ras-like GTPase activity (Roadblock/LC7/MglB family)
MKTHPRREFLLRVLAVCGTPLMGSVGSASAGQAPQTAQPTDAHSRVAASYFDAGADAARAIGEAYFRQHEVEATRTAILEHASGAVQILAAAASEEAALADLVNAVCRDFQEGRVLLLGGWVVSRTEVELCVLTLLPAAV